MGEYWSVDYGEKSFRLKDTKGFGYLAHLIRHPALEQAEVRRFHAKMLIDRSALGDRKMAQALLDRAAEIYSACRVISR